MVLKLTYMWDFMEQKMLVPLHSEISSKEKYIITNNKRKENSG